VWNRVSAIQVVVIDGVAGDIRIRLLGLVEEWVEGEELPAGGVVVAVNWRARAAGWRDSDGS
jgi:hypothetical protein